MKSLGFMAVERACGGEVEMFHVEQDTMMPYRLRITFPDGKQYAVAMQRLEVMKAVAKQWARGQTCPPWAHLGYDWTLDDERDRG